MKKFAILAAASAVALALAGCGKSDSAKEQATADNVEMPAEEGVPTDPAATPVADGSAMPGAEAATTASPAAAPKP